MKVFAIFLVFATVQVSAQTRVRENVKQQAVISSDDGAVEVATPVVKASVSRPKKAAAKK